MTYWPMTISAAVIALSTGAATAQMTRPSECEQILRLGPDTVRVSVYNACLQWKNDSSGDSPVVIGNGSVRKTTSSRFTGTAAGNGVTVHAGDGGSMTHVTADEGGVDASAGGHADPTVDVSVGDTASGSLADVSVNDGGVGASVGGSDPAIDVSVGGTASGTVADASVNDGGISVTAGEDDSIADVSISQ